MVRKIIPDIVSGQDLLQLTSDASVQEAAVGMAARGVNSVLITEAGQLKGIFTGTDLIRKVVAAGLDPANTAMRDVMTPNPETVGPNDNALHALRQMQTKGFRHLPIVDNGEVVGILSRRDFLGYEEDEIEHQEKLWQKI